MKESNVLDWLIYMSPTLRESTLKLAKAISRGLRIPLPAALILVYENKPASDYRVG